MNRINETGRKRQRTFVQIGLGLYLLALGFLVGMLADRIRFDKERDAVLQPYEEALRQWHAYRIRIERENNRASSADQ